MTKTDEFYHGQLFERANTAYRLLIDLADTSVLPVDIQDEARCLAHDVRQLIGVLLETEIPSEYEEEDDEYVCSEE